MKKTNVERLDPESVADRETRRRKAAALQAQLRRRAVPMDRLALIVGETFGAPCVLILAREPDKMWRHVSAHGCGTSDCDALSDFVARRAPLVDLEEGVAIMQTNTAPDGVVPLGQHSASLWLPIRENGILIGLVMLIRYSVVNVQLFDVLDRERLSDMSPELREFLAASPGADTTRARRADATPRDMDHRVHQMSQTAKVVFPLHGIRTQAPWQRTFSDLAQSAGWTCRLGNWYFGRFSLIRFFLPRARAAKVRWFARNYLLECSSKDVKLEGDQLPSIVAHSFGTYILGNALLKYDHIRFNKVILCASILPIDFPWNELLDRGQVQAVRNEYGKKDIWVRYVSLFVTGTGASGANGFSCVHNRIEQTALDYSHSEYMDQGHMKQHWLPFLEGESPWHAAVKRDIQRPKRTYPWLLYCLYASMFGGIFLAVHLLGLARWISRLR